MATELYFGETIKLQVSVRDSGDVLFDPDELRITAVKPSGVEIQHELDDIVPTIFSSSSGVYLTYFDADELGTWEIVVRTIYEENGANVVDIEASEYVVYANPSSAT